MCAHSQPHWHMGTPGIHFALRRNSTPPPAFIFLENPPPIKGSRGQEVSPEIARLTPLPTLCHGYIFLPILWGDLALQNCHSQGMGSFPTNSPESHHCPGVPGKMLSVSLRRPRETARSFASPEQLVIYLAITASVAAVGKIRAVQKTGTVPCSLSDPFPPQGSALLTA